MTVLGALMLVAVTACDGARGRARRHGVCAEIMRARRRRGGDYRRARNVLLVVLYAIRDWHDHLRSLPYREKCGRVARSQRPTHPRRSAQPAPRTRQAVVPNLQLYVPSRDALIVNNGGVARRGGYIANVLVYSALYAAGVLLFAAMIFRKRDLV